jgi:tetratricopeptide (TPR) repeat protein
VRSNQLQVDLSVCNTVVVRPLPPRALRCLHMKFYVHFETAALGPLPGGEATLIVEQTSAPTTTVAELCNAVLRRYDSSRPGAATPLAKRGGSLSLSTHGAVLDSSTTIQSLVKSGDDIWVVQGRPAQPAPPIVSAPGLDESCEPQVDEPIEEFTTDGAREVELELAASVAAAAGGPNREPGPKARSNPYEQALDKRAAAKTAKLLKSSAEALAQRNYRTARQLHTQIFVIDRTNAQARREAAMIDLDNRDPDAAEAHIGVALSARPKPTDPLLYVELGNVYRQQHEFEDAVDAYQSALKHAKQRDQYRADAKWTNDVKILMARAYLALNPREATDANNLIREVLGSDPNHRNAILFYGEVMLERQNVAEALPMYLRLVAASMGEDKAIKKPIAQLLDMPGAVDHLEATLPPANKAGADIYGYLGGLAKDRSKLTVATRLYRTAIEMDGRRPTYLLNHIHTLELSWSYQEAFMDAVEWLTAKVNSHPGDSAGDIRSSVVLEALESCNFQCSIDPGLRSKGSKVAYVACSDPAGISTENESAVGADGKKRTGAKRGDTLDRESLDLLAVFFTLCKISFVAGELEVLPALIRILETEHRERDLHLTLIKNEAAYFVSADGAHHLVVFIPAYGWTHQLHLLHNRDASSS